MRSSITFLRKHYFINLSILAIFTFFFFSDFKKMHEKNFSKMTDITAEHARRMKYLSANSTSGNKKTTPSTTARFGSVPDIQCL